MWVPYFAQFWLLRKSRLFTGISSRKIFSSTSTSRRACRTSASPEWARATRELRAPGLAQGGGEGGVRRTRMITLRCRGPLGEREGGRGGGFIGANVFHSQKEVLLPFVRNCCACCVFRCAFARCEWLLLSLLMMMIMIMMIAT